MLSNQVGVIFDEAGIEEVVAPRFDYTADDRQSPSEQSYEISLPQMDFRMRVI
jgi:hypothetical protein